MGYGREVHDEMMIDAAIEYDKYRAYQFRLMYMNLWAMEDGSLISISEMTMSHIINCIRMLSDRGDGVSEMWLERFRREIRERSEKMSLSVTLCSDLSCDDP